MEPPLTAYPQHGTERLTIRPLGAADAEALQLLTDDPVITSRITFLTSPFTLADAEGLIGRNDQENCFLGVWQQAALIGVAGTHLRGSDQLEIGYWFGPQFQGRGYAAEAVSAVIANLRQIHPARQIIARCMRKNERSWNLLHKLGFREAVELDQRPGYALLTFSSA